MDMHKTIGDKLAKNAKKVKDQEGKRVFAPIEEQSSMWQIFYDAWHKMPANQH